jgi:universal stress protein A
MSDALEEGGSGRSGSRSPRAERPALFSARRILVPVDFSACSLAALEHAVSLAQRFGSSIDVLHVWPLPRALSPDGALAVPGHMLETVAEFAEGEADRSLDAVLYDVAQSGVAVRALLERGDPAAAIVQVAGDGNYDLVVMGTHGHTGLSHLVRGRVAERVVRRAPCPVLTIRVVDPGMHAGVEEEAEAP